MNIKIVVAAHKPYRFPKDALYLPLQVGAVGKADIILGIARDDSGENISDKNQTFCELTGLFLCWKNLESEAVGLCHYRRYLGNQRFWLPKEERLLSRSEIDRLLSTHDIILP